MSKGASGKQTYADTQESRATEVVPAPDSGPLPANRQLDPAKGSLRDHAVELQDSIPNARPGSIIPGSISRTGAKHRLGLPQGFVSRLGRYGRTALLEDNVYRLPNGEELITQHPSGTLGGRRHTYALLTAEQYEQGKRGSVYVRTDGRIFDYAFDHGNPDRELFDTGFSIHDLERTGRYISRHTSKTATPDKRRKKRLAGLRR
ncbi:MAG: hypothetical protein ACR2LM_00585 [Pyrinomonadaceae bacterium]